MNLYFTKTTYQLLESITHKIVNHPNEPAVIMINHGHTTNYSNYMDLTKLGFCKVIIYSTGKITSSNTSAEDVLVEDIVKYYDALLEENDCSIDGIQNIYVFAALRFSIYLSEKKREFNLFEDAPGCAISSSYVLWRDNTDEVDKKTLAEKYKLIDGENQYIKNIYYNDVKGKINKDNAIEYDVCEVLKTLPRNTIDKILDFFDEKKFVCSKSINNLVLFRHCYPLDDSFVVNQNKLLELVIDWFTVEGNIVVKTHPMDTCDYMADSSLQWIGKQLPSELLPFVLNRKINNVIALATSSFNSMQNECFDICLLGFDIIHCIKLIPKQIVAMQLLSFLNLKEYSFSVCGMYTQNVQNMIKRYIGDEYNCTWANFKFDNINIVLLDQFIWGQNKNNYEEQIRKHIIECRDDVITVFFDANNEMTPFKVVDYDNISNLIICKLQFEEIESHCIIKEECFYVYTKSEFVQRKIREFTYARVLPYSKVIVRLRMY